MNKNFLVLKGSKRTIFLLKKIKKYFPDSKIFLLDKNIACSAKKYSDFFIHEDAENYKKIKKKIFKLNLFMCITRSSGTTGLIVTKINNLINFHKANINEINQFFSGHKLSSLCKKNKLNYIKTSYASIKSNFDLPIVVKSDIEKIGKKNVFLVEKNELYKTSFIKSKKLSLNKKVISQEYIDGFDITIIGYAYDDKNFMIKKVYKEKNNFSKNGSIKHNGFVQFKIPKDTIYFNQIKKAIDLIILKSNLQFVPINFNFRISKNKKKSYLNELNLYFGGENLIENDFDFISDYFKFIKVNKYYEI